MENHQRLIWRSPALSRCFPRIMNFYYSEEKAIGQTNMIPSSLGPTQENDSFYQVLLMQLFLKMCFPFQLKFQSHSVQQNGFSFHFFAFFSFMHTLLPTFCATVWLLLQKQKAFYNVHICMAFQFSIFQHCFQLYDFYLK